MTDGATQEVTETKPAETAPAAAKADPVDDLPPGPPPRQVSADDLVNRVKKEVLATIQQSVAETPKRGKHEEDPKHPFHKYFEANPENFVLDIADVVSERVKTEVATENRERQKATSTWSEGISKYENLAKFPNEVTAEVYRVQQEYKAKHEVELPYAEALKTAIPRTAKRLELKERSEDDIALATLPGSVGGYSPSAPAPKMMSGEDYIKNLQTHHKKFKVRQG